MAQVAEITFGQKVMRKETEKRISERSVSCQIPAPPPQTLAAPPGGPSSAPAFFQTLTGSFDILLFLCALTQVLGRCRPVWD